MFTFENIFLPFLLHYFFIFETFLFSFFVVIFLGFKDQIYDVFQVLPQNIQVGLFSATMPTEALEITQKFMNNPLRILVKQEEITLEGKRIRIFVFVIDISLRFFCLLFSRYSSILY